MSARLPRWPLALIAAPAAIAVWSGWVGLGALCGFGVVHPLPGIVPGFRLDTAITLPVGVESYGAYALGAWLTPGVTGAARTFARRSALGALALGMAGQVAYHVLAAAHATRAPWWVVTLVSCLPVVTLAFGAALAHLLRAGPGVTEPGPARATVPGPLDDGPGGPARERLSGPQSVPDPRPGPAAWPAPGGPAPARPGLPVPVPAPVSSRAGVEHARANYRASVAAGTPLSARALAARHGISRRQAAKIITAAPGAALSLVPAGAGQ